MGSESSLVPGIPREQFTITHKFDQDYAFPHIPTFLKPREMVQDNQSTSSKSHTRSSQKINELDKSDLSLVHLRTSASLWKNFIHYADPTRCEADGGFDKNTLGVVRGGKPEARPADSALGVMGMEAAARFFTTYKSAQETVNSQQSVRDSAFEFVSQFTHFAIMQRYANVRAPAHNQRIRLEHHLAWRANVVSQDQAPVDLEGVQTLAGHADGILQSGARGNRDTNAILMTKPSWAYNDDALDNIFEGHILRADTEEFDWGLPGVSFDLVRQFWGCLVLMDCKFGIWTNGNKIFLGVRTDKQTLVLTPTQTWAHNDTTRAIIGLTYAAIDYARWKAKNIDIIPQLVGHTRLIGQD